MPPRRPRVLLVTPDFPPREGGIQILLDRVVRNAKGVDFRVLTLGQPQAEAFDRSGRAEVRRVGNAEGDRRLAGLVLNAATLSEARRFRPDLILSGHAIGSLGAIALRRALRVPLVQYVHADEFRVRARVTAAAVRAADLTIAVSEYTRAMAIDAGADAERVEVIHPGVDLPPPAAAAGPREPVILTVATLLFRYKGHDVTMRALPLIRAKIPDARWVVIGDGPLRPALDNAVAAYGLGDAVELLGRVDDGVRDGWLERAGVFCMPSRVPAAGVGGEGFGIVYMEAAARGLPSIGGDVAGARDAVRDGETGVLVNPTDHLAVAEAAVSVLGDGDRGAEMSRAARAWAEQHDWPLIAARVEAAIVGVLGRGPGSR